MRRTIPPPHPNPHPPTRLNLPAGACDAHCHVFGPADIFPFAPERTYTPPDSGFEDLVRAHDRLGLDRGVVVQASCHGYDNSAMVTALRRGCGRFAGVAMIDETADQSALADLHEAGVRGVRFNFVRHLGARIDLDLLWGVVDRIAPLGWHLDLHFDADDLSRHRDMFDRLPIPFIIDHMGRVSAADGPAQGPFLFLLGLLAGNERAWVKISGAERVTASTTPAYDDVIPFVRELVATAPERVLWGTDWPHPNVRVMPDDGDLVDLLAQSIPDGSIRDRILVDNPAVLYDFAPADDTGPG